MKDYKVTVKVRNNRIIAAIDSSGGSLGQKWCDSKGLPYNAVNDLVNMTVSPLLKGGKLSVAAQKLCDVTESLPADLWSNEQLYPLEKNFSEIEMDYAQVMALLPSDQQEYVEDFGGIEARQTKTLLDGLVSKLTPIQQEVLRLRFEEDLTLAQCGERVGRSQERIRQIEAKALRRLRRPENAEVINKGMGM